MFQSSEGNRQLVRYIGSGLLSPKRHNSSLDDSPQCSAANAYGESVETRSSDRQQDTAARGITALLMRIKS